MDLQQHFSLKRFYNYLKFDLILNIKKYLVFITVLCIVLFVIDFYLISNASHSTYDVNNLRVRQFRLSTYQATFCFSFIASMALVAGSSFPAFRQKISTINYFLIPVSILEKFIVQFGLRVLVFSSVFVLLFWLDFKLATYVYNLFEWKNHVEVPSFDLFNLFPDDMSVLDKRMMVLSLFSVASFMFASSTFFKKHAFLKSILLLGVFCFTAYIFSFILSHIFLPEEVQGFSARIFDRKLDNNLNTIQIFFYVIGGLSSLFFIPLAYFKLKEKEA